MYALVFSHRKKRSETENELLIDRCHSKSLLKSEELIYFCVAMCEKENSRGNNHSNAVYFGLCCILLTSTT